jgi:hypothetical protein
MDFLAIKMRSTPLSCVNFDVHVDGGRLSRTPATGGPAVLPPDHGFPELFGSNHPSPLTFSMHLPQAPFYQTK